MSMMQEISTKQGNQSCLRQMLYKPLRIIEFVYSIKQRNNKHFILSINSRFLNLYLAILFGGLTLYILCSIHTYICILVLFSFCLFNIYPKFLLNNCQV